MIFNTFNFTPFLSFCVCVKNWISLIYYIFSPYVQNCKFFLLLFLCAFWCNYYLKWETFAFFFLQNLDYRRIIEIDRISICKENMNFNASNCEENLLPIILQLIKKCCMYHVWRYVFLFTFKEPVCCETSDAGDI